jgi:hypothetical protein
MVADYFFLLDVPYGLSYLFNYGLFAGLMTDISFFADG